MLVTINGLANEIPGLTKNAIYAKSRAGEIPHIKVGTKRLYDVDLVKKWLLDSAMSNVKQQDEEKVIAYGKLRRMG